MRYVEARITEYSREEAYRIYITKSLQLIPQSKYLTLDFKDAITPKKVDTRSGEQIALDIMKAAGLSFKEK